jgi:hypothetical protein
VASQDRHDGSWHGDVSRVEKVREGSYRQCGRRVICVRWRAARSTLHRARRDCVQRRGVGVMKVQDLAGGATR